MAFLASVGRGIRNSWTGTIGFFRNSFRELKKVRWPSRKELVTYTIVVIFIVLAVTVFFFFVDLGIAKIVQLITK